MRHAIHPAVFLGGVILICASWLWFGPPVTLSVSPPRSASRPVPVERASIRLDTAVLERYVGRYRGRADFTVDITLKDGRLFAQATGTIPFELLATSETEFFLKGAGFDVTFRLDRDGGVRGFAVDTDLGIIEVERVR